MALCDKCRNLFNISKTIKTGITYGGNSKLAKKITNIIDTFTAGEKITQLMVNDIKISDVTNSVEFNSMLQKDSKKLLELLNKLIIEEEDESSSESENENESEDSESENESDSDESSSDESDIDDDYQDGGNVSSDDEKNSSGKVNTSYYICNNCGFNKPIPIGEIIYNKNYGISDYEKLENYSLSINDNTLPRTTIYNCPNKSCPSIKDANLHEAIITHNSQYQAIYVCCACKTYWIN